MRNSFSATVSFTFLTCFTDPTKSRSMFYKSKFRFHDPEILEGKNLLDFRKRRHPVRFSLLVVGISVRVGKGNKSISNFQSPYVLRLPRFIKDNSEVTFARLIVLKNLFFRSAKFFDEEEKTSLFYGGMGSYNWYSKMLQCGAAGDPRHLAASQNVSHISV